MTFPNDASYDNDSTNHLAGSTPNESPSQGDSREDETVSIVGDAGRDLEVDTLPVQSLVSGAATGQREAGGQRFRVLRHHAKGGLGEVSVARDLELDRDVALKQIQSRFADDEGSRQRFLLEARVTGNLEHPGIVPIYGLGQDHDGRPYYAMRFIQGDSLKEAADAFHQTSTEESAADFSQLAFRQLLRRFLDVCNAIEYAHSRGVLHRDLKPGNVMLGKYGETLVVDWGLAKVQQRAEEPHSASEAAPALSFSDGAAPTQMGAAIGTPAYMPPEQAAGKLDQLGPASDVYSLGATLYHVLTGRAPFDKGEPRIVLSKVEAGEFPSPRSVQPIVPPALEAICLKAMALRPVDRYQTPRALADEIERFLADEPVTAHAEPATIRARRWFRKHPRVVAALAASVIVGVTGALTIAAVVAAKNNELATANEELKKANTAEIAARAKERQAKETAVLRQKQALAAQRKEKAERERAEAVADFMFASFRKSDPARDGRELKVADILDQAVERIDEDLPEQPILQAQLLHAIGQTYRGLGLPKECLAVSQRVYDLRREHLGEDDPQTVATLSHLAAAYELAGDPAKAVELFQVSLDQVRAKVGEDHPDTLKSLNTLAGAHHTAGNVIKAIQMQEDCLKRSRKILGEDHIVTVIARNNLGRMYFAKGDILKARPLFEQCLEPMRANRGDDHPETLTLMSNLANAYASANEFEKAISLFDRCLKLMRVKLGDDHPDTLLALNGLALTHRAAGDVAIAVRLWSQCLEQSQASLGEDHPDTLAVRNNLAMAYLDAGDTIKARPLLEKCIDQMRAKLIENHPHLLTAHANLAAIYRSSGEHAKALPLLEASLEDRRAKLGDNHADTLTSMNNLGMVYLETGDLAKATPLLKQCLDQRRVFLGENHADTLMSILNLALAYRSAGEMEKALPLYEQSLEQTRAALGEDHPQTVGMLGSLAKTYLLAGQPDRALPLYDQFVDAKRKRSPSDDPGFAGLLASVSFDLLQYQQFAAAEKYLRECTAIRQTKLPKDWLTFNTMSMLGGTLVGQQKFVDAEPLLLQGYQGLKEREAAIPPQGKIRVEEALERLIELYTAWERPAEAAKWQAIEEPEPPAPE